ncbi:MAG: DUF1735 domain-containing protein [Bacteroides sp.]|uniref:BT_3987 domain-containing protein n=1 Tax=Bacteroides sp. TaxID=29523 RepID=UPI002FC9F874
MRKNRLFIGLAAMLLLTQAGCDDSKGEFLEDFSTILYFKNSGETPLTLYKTGENTDYSIVVNKAGSDLSAITDVSVGIMDQASLAVYNAEHGTTYREMPTDCYTFQSGKLQFASSETHKNMKLTLITTEIDKLEPSEGTYVIPFEMYGSPDSINSRKNVLFINPKVVIPEIYFKKTGYQMNTISDEGAAQISLTLPLVLPLENKWNFNCTVGINETLLNDYNKENEVDYSLLPLTAYTMNKDGVVAFEPGGASSELTININRSGLSYGNYVLPLQLNSCSHPTFLIDPTQNTCLFGVSYVPEESKLSQVALKESMIGIFPDPTNEGSIAEMIDGKADTYYHSNWEGKYPLPHHIDLRLSKESNAFIFEYQTRHDTNNGTPQLISIYGSMDGVTFKKITTISENLPTEVGQKYKSPVLVGKPFKVLRISVEKTPNGNSFAFAELKLSVN